jgi:hypothetical protein
VAAEEECDFVSVCWRMYDLLFVLVGRYGNDKKGKHVVSRPKFLILIIEIPPELLLSSRSVWPFEMYLLTMAFFIV